MSRWFGNWRNQPECVFRDQLLTCNPNAPISFKPCVVSSATFSISSFLRASLDSYTWQEIMQLNRTIISSISLEREKWEPKCRVKPTWKVNMWKHQPSAARGFGNTVNKFWSFLISYKKVNKAKGQRKDKAFILFWHFLFCISYAKTFLNWECNL